MSSIKHAHHSSTHKTLAYVKELGGSLDGWKFSSEKDNVKIYTKEATGSMPITRGDTVLEAGWTLQQVAAICLSIGARTIWDERFDNAEIKERYSLHEILFHSKMKGTWPIPGRDIAGSSIVEKNDHELIISMSSVVDPLIPETTSHVRADLLAAAWILKLLEDGKISLTYVVHINLGGSIPTTFLKLVQNQTPLCAGKVADFARKFGFPPYVKSVEGHILREHFDPKKRIYEIEVDALEEHGIIHHNGTIVFEVSKKMFPEGFGIQTSVPEAIHEKEEADGNTIVSVKGFKEPVVITLSKP
jgi:hypothetical protein